MAGLLLSAPLRSAATASSSSSSSDHHHLSFRQPDAHTPDLHLNLPTNPEPEAEDMSPSLSDEEEDGATVMRRTRLNGGSSTLQLGASSTLPPAASSFSQPVGAPHSSSANPRLPRPLRPAVTNAVSPTPWPEQFHAVLFQNRSASLALTDLWYDWPGGRNLNAIRTQLTGRTLFDVEWNNGTR